MTTNTTGGVRSKVHLVGHPIHPMLIPFPIAFLLGAAVTDAAFAMVEDEFWATASFWLLAGGFVTGVLAAAVGLIDFVAIERARSHQAGWIHAVGNGVVIVIALLNWLARIDDHTGFIKPWGLALSIVTAILLGATEWTGGELSYRHQIGVTGHE